MTPITWTESRVVNGVTFTAEVQQHSFAGHGPVAGRYRWSIWRESQYRPLMASGVTSWHDSSIKAACESLQALD
jgi:hypothetical protein